MLYGAVADRRIAVFGDEDAIAQCAPLLHPSDTTDTSGAGGAIEGTRVDVEIVARMRRRGGGARTERPLEPWFFYGAVQCSRGAQGTRADDGSSFADVSVDGSRIELFLAADDSAERGEIRAVTLRIALLLALRAQDVFELHAGAIECSPGAATLLVGPSGAGKSTLTAALVEGGGRYLGDDTALLWRVGGEIGVGAMRRAFFLGDAALAALPGLASIATATTLHGDKWGVDPALAWSAPPIARSRPEILLFPTIERGLEASVVVPIADAEALGELVAASALLMVDEPARRLRHLAMLNDLVRHCVCRRVELGADLLARPVETARRLVDACATNPSRGHRAR